MSKDEMTLSSFVHIKSFTYIIDTIGQEKGLMLSDSEKVKVK